MLEKKLEIGFEYFPNKHSFSVHQETVVLEDGVELSRSLHTKSFLPGQLDELAAYLGDKDHPLVSYCNIIWTPEIIKMQEEFNKQSLN